MWLTGEFLDERIVCSFSLLPESVVRLRILHVDRYEMDHVDDHQAGNDEGEQAAE